MILSTKRKEMFLQSPVAFNHDSGTFVFLDTKEIKADINKDITSNIWTEMITSVGI